MSGLASCILRGEPALLVAGQAKLLGRTDSHEIYQLNTAEFRIAMWDVTTRTLVVFDAAALVALALSEASDDRREQVRKRADAAASRAIESIVSVIRVPVQCADSDQPINPPSRL